MKSSIIQEFKGEINNVEINDKTTFYSTEYILQNIEDKFGECYNNQFIKDLSSNIETLRFKLEDFNQATLENEFISSIENADKFKDIEFTYDGSQWKLEKLNENIKNNSYENNMDKQKIIEGLKSKELDLENLDKNLQADKDIVLAAVTVKRIVGIALQYASPELRADKEVVLAAAKNNGLSLEYASPELKADKEIVLAAVANRGPSLQYASSELKADKEIVLGAVTNTGSSLEYASSKLRADKEVVLAAVKENGWALKYASPELRADKEVVLTAVTNTGSSLADASPELRADKEIVLAAVKENGWALENASPELRADKDVVLAAVTNNCKALMFADDKLKDDRDVVKQAYYDVCVYHVNLDSHNDYLSDAEIEKEVQRYADEVLQYASPRLQKEFGMSKEKQQELQQEQTKGWGARTGNSKSHGIAD